MRQNRPEDEREDTTTTLYDHEDANEPNNIPVSPLYLLECHTSVNSMNESNILERRPTAEPSDLIGFIKTYRDMPSKTGDSWTPMKSTTANPKPADDTPPISYHPRYGASIWPDTTQHRINGQPENNAEYHRRTPETHKNDPNPLSCHNYGQRSKHAGQNRPAYKHQNNRADTLRTLKLKTKTQPTSDLAKTNQ
jgi:hypothetical protein